MARRTVRHIAGLAVAGIALTGAIGATTASAAEAAPGSIFVISHNLQKKNGAIDAVNRMRANHAGPEVLLLQEVCASQVGRIKKPGDLAIFRERKNPNKNCGGEGIGEMAVWTGDGNVGTSRHDLGAQQQGGHTYGLACVTFNHAGRKTRACSTHLAAGDSSFDPVRQATTAAIRDKANGWIGDGMRVIVGGDFNSRPDADAMDAMYADGGGGANGPFRELHQMTDAPSNRAGDNTFYKKKIDYIFISKVDSRSSGGTEQVCKKCTPSDHRILWGRVPLKARG